MRRFTLVLAAALLVLLAYVVFLRLPAPVAWPELPSSHLLHGRQATAEDVRRGDAAFALEQNGAFVGLPEPLTLPQYAWSYDREEHCWRPSVVIQAERVRGGSLFFGVRRVSGSRGGALAIEDHIVLLGLGRPSRYAKAPPPRPDTHTSLPYPGASVNVILGREQ